MLSFIVVAFGLYASSSQMGIHLPQISFKTIESPWIQVIHYPLVHIELNPSTSNQTTLNQIIPLPHPAEWIDLVSTFMRAFTFYGFVMLSAVALWRFGRAMFDQSERLFDRRHALRQGRLYVHLAAGKISIEEMEKAFAWNQAQANAFENLATDAKAPWGAILSELIKTAPALVQAGTDMANANTKAKANRENNPNEGTTANSQNK